MEDFKELKSKLEKAVVVLQALPKTSKTMPVGYKSAWPEMIRPGKKGDIIYRGRSYAMPNSRDITECYQIIDSLYHLTEMQRQLIWARASHIPWRMLQQRFRRSRSHLYRLYLGALSSLSQSL